MSEAGHAPREDASSPLRGIAGALLSYVRTRAQLASNELEEQVLRLSEIALWALLALFAAGVALVMLSLLAVLLFWDSHRVLAAGLVAALWLAAATACALLARVRARARPQFLAAMLGEFDKDRSRFGHRDA